MLSTLLCTSYFLSNPTDRGVSGVINPTASIPPIPLVGVLITVAAAEARRASALASRINTPDLDISAGISRKKRRSISGVTGSLVVRLRWYGVVRTGRTFFLLCSFLVGLSIGFLVVRLCIVQRLSGTNTERVSSSV